MRNKDILTKVGVAHIEEMQENHLCMQCRPMGTAL